jgi:hypothetical protein
VDPRELNFVIIYGWIALVSGIVVFLDWFGRRQERRSRRDH